MSNRVPRLEESVTPAQWAEYRWLYENAWDVMQRRNFIDSIAKYWPAEAYNIERGWKVNESADAGLVPRTP